MRWIEKSEKLYRGGVEEKFFCRRLAVTNLAPIVLIRFFIFSCSVSPFEYVFFFFATISYHKARWWHFIASLSFWSLFMSFFLHFRPSIYDNLWHCRHDYHNKIQFLSSLLTRLFFSCFFFLIYVLVIFICC